MASIQVKCFAIRAVGDDAAEDALNRFLRGRQVLEVRQEFVPDGANSLWCLAVRYAVDAAGEGERPAKVDYREVLEPEVFARFVELRKRRKAIAEADALPPFVVFTDEELAGIARLECPSLAALRGVKGIGAKKAERFGARILTPNGAGEGGDAAGNGIV